MTEASNTVELHENHERIWLSPRCEEERTWCEDDIGCCDECGEPTVEYVRADLYASQAEDIERLTALVEQAFRDGLAYATNVTLSRPEEYDIAWQQSRIRALIGAKP